eukprot:scaffold113977_cov28-Tisochrysis_lutea.AAC.1
MLVRGADFVLAPSALWHVQPRLGDSPIPPRKRASFRTPSDTMLRECITWCVLRTCTPMALTP